MARAGHVFVGISGFRYASFRGKFYPRGLPAREELAYAASRFDSIELNGPFYSLQRPDYYRAWYAQTPPGFVFAVKGSRYITHLLKLRNVESALANFFASGVLCLGEKLGPFLWQFPAGMPCDHERFDRFFRLLPRDARQAAALARRHDRRLAGRAAFGPRSSRALRHAVEVRSPACATPQFVQLLRRHRIALVVADTAGRFPYLEDVTADFVYVRLHGDEELYASGYSPAAISRWAARVDLWRTGRQPGDAHLASPARPPRRAGRDVYVYFDNDIKAHAPFDAMALSRALSAA